MVPAFRDFLGTEFVVTDDATQPDNIKGEYSDGDDPM